MSIIYCKKCDIKHERNAIPMRCPACKVEYKNNDGKLTCYHRIFWTCHVCGHKWRQEQKYPGPHELKAENVKLKKQIEEMDKLRIYEALYE